MTSYPHITMMALPVSSLLGFGDIDDVSFSTSRTFGHIWWPYGHGDQWVSRV